MEITRGDTPTLCFLLVLEKRDVWRVDGRLVAVELDGFEEDREFGRRDPALRRVTEGCGETGTRVVVGVLVGGEDAVEFIGDSRGVSPVLVHVGWFGGCVWWCW